MDQIWLDELHRLSAGSFHDGRPRLTRSIIEYQVCSILISYYDVLHDVSKFEVLYWWYSPINDLQARCIEINLPKNIFSILRNMSSLLIRYFLTNLPRSVQFIYVKLYTGISYKGATFCSELSLTCRKNSMIDIEVQLKWYLLCRFPLKYLESIEHVLSDLNEGIRYFIVSITE